MNIPHSRDIYPLILATICVTFYVLAIINVYNGVGLFASVIWILFVTVLVIASCRGEGGWRRCVVSFMAGLSKNHFVEAASMAGTHHVIRFGFYLRGRHFIEKTIAFSDIESVEWHAGQATDRMGRDMNDWYVTIWYDHNNPTKTERRQNYRKPDQECFVFGPSAAKELTTLFAQSFITFLQNAGLKLETVPDETCYRRPC